ncbi:MAG: tRNA (adenosine(37)-N6)-threonylcarbamoyltransferase complex ATPase subunit type 1 TsaE [Ehrlichia sp.]
MQFFKYDFVSLLFLRRLAGLVASNLKSGDAIFLCGDLGVGKTAFVKFLVCALVPCEDVGSPTFSIVNEYHSAKFTIYHVDLYRVNHLYEIYDLGLECICDNGVGIIEWPDLLDGILNFSLKINMKYSIKEDLRDIEVLVNDSSWSDIFTLL